MEAFRGVFCRLMRWWLSYQIEMAKQAANFAAVIFVGAAGRDRALDAGLVGALALYGTPVLSALAAVIIHRRLQLSLAETLSAAAC